LPSTIVWATNLLLMHVQTWWSMYGMRFHSRCTFLEFAVVLLQPVILFLLATVVLPSPSAAQQDLRANYFTQRRWFCGLLIALLVVSVCRDLLLTGKLPDTPNLLFHILFLVGAIGGWITAREIYHQSLALGSFGAITIYIAILFANLR